MKLSQNIGETTTSIGLSCILQIEPTLAPCDVSKDVGEPSYLDEM